MGAYVREANKVALRSRLECTNESELISAANDLGWGIVQVDVLKDGVTHTLLHWNQALHRSDLIVCCNRKPLASTVLKAMIA